MNGKYLIETCVFCNNNATKGKRVFEKEIGVCPKCGRNEWLLLEVDDDGLLREKPKNIKDDSQK